MRLAVQIPVPQPVDAAWVDKVNGITERDIVQITTIKDHPRYCTMDRHVIRAGQTIIITIHYGAINKTYYQIVDRIEIYP